MLPSLLMIKTEEDKEDEHHETLSTFTQADFAQCLTSPSDGEQICGNARAVCACARPFLCLAKPQMEGNFVDLTAALVFWRRRHSIDVTARDFGVCSVWFYGLMTVLMWNMCNNHCVTDST